MDSPESLPDWIMPWPAFEVDWTRTALLVIDYQNYSANPECGLTRMISERYRDVARYYVPAYATRSHIHVGCCRRFGNQTGKSSSRGTVRCCPMAGT